MEPLKRVAGSGRLVPLNLDDTEAIAAELPHSELPGTPEVATTDDVLQFFANPEATSPEEQTHFTGRGNDGEIPDQVRHPGLPPA